LMALDLPLLVAGTFGDVALEEGEPVDWEKLTRILEVPIVPVVPPKGWGVPELRREIQRLLRNPPPRRYPLPYPRPMRGLVAQLERITEEAGLPPRRSAALLLMGNPPLNEVVPDPGSREEAEGAMAAFRRESRISDIPLALLTFWHSLAQVIAQAAQKPHRHLPRKLERILTAPLSGTICALALMLFIFTALFLVGGWLSEGLTFLWRSGVSPLLQGAVHGLLGQTAWARVVLWGIDDGVLAALTVGVPTSWSFT
jgi:Fe2+ transport system protein B